MVKLNITHAGGHSKVQLLRELIALTKFPPDSWIGRVQLPCFFQEMVALLVVAFGKLLSGFPYQPICFIALRRQRIVNENRECHQSKSRDKRPPGGGHRTGIYYINSGPAREFFPVSSGQIWTPCHGAYGADVCL